MDNMLTRTYARIPAKPFVFGYAALYVLMLGLLAGSEHFDVGEPLFVLGVLGIGFTGLAWPGW